MISVMNWCQLAPGHLGDGIKLAVDYARSSVAEESGCRRVDIVRDEENPTKFAWYEIYDDEGAFENHRETAHFEKFHREEYKQYLVAGTFPSANHFSRAAMLNGAPPARPHRRATPSTAASS
tara:strand:+ start:178 stop:543 length:366 start_codon:yes stop_codon:yes gene_type:complete